MSRIKSIHVKIIISIVLPMYAALLHFTKLGCPVLKLTGLPCIGCGMTRAIVSALKLDFVAAFGYHFMFWSVPILYLYMIFDGVLFKNKILNRAVFGIIAAGFFINWIYRLIA